VLIASPAVDSQGGGEEEEEEADAGWLLECTMTRQLDYIAWLCVELWMQSAVPHSADDNDEYYNYRQ